MGLASLERIDFGANFSFFLISGLMVLEDRS